MEYKDEIRNWSTASRDCGGRYMIKTAVGTYIHTLTLAHTLLEYQQARIKSSENPFSPCAGAVVAAAEAPVPIIDADARRQIPRLRLVKPDVSRGVVSLSPPRKLASAETVKITVRVWKSTSPPPPADHTHCVSLCIFLHRFVVCFCSILSLSMRRCGVFILYIDWISSAEHRYFYFCLFLTAALCLTHPAHI